MQVTNEQSIYASDLASTILKREQETKNYGKYRKNPFNAVFGGFIGEVVFADTYNLQRPTFNKNAYDGGFDFVYKGFNIDVKTTCNKNARYLITHFGDKNKPTDYYFEYKLDLNTLKINPMGFISKKDFEKYHIVKDFGYGLRKAIKYNNKCFTMNLNEKLSFKLNEIKRFLHE